MELTNESQRVLKRHFKDRGNWNDQPLLQISSKERGNVTDLKRKKLISTFSDEGCEWVLFTELGLQYCRNMGWDAKEGE